MLIKNTNIKWETYMKKDDSVRNLLTWIPLFFHFITYIECHKYTSAYK